MLYVISELVVVCKSVNASVRGLIPWASATQDSLCVLDPERREMILQEIIFLLSSFLLLLIMSNCEVCQCISM